MMGMVDSLQVEEHDLLVSVYHANGDKISEIWVVAEEQGLMNELMSD